LADACTVIQTSNILFYTYPSNFKSLYFLTQTTSLKGWLACQHQTWHEIRVFPIWTWDYWPSS